METKRILFVTDSPYLPRGLTGANVSLHALASRLIALGHEPIVICTPDAEDEPAPGPPGYTVRRTPDPAAAMHEMLRLSPPASVVLRAPDPAERIAARAAAAGAPRLHVYFESAFFRREFPSPRAAPNLRYAACSPYLARLAETYLGAPVAVVPPLIEAEDYRCAATGDAILFVNPTPIKGVHIAEAIAARLPRRRFLFVRSWPDHPNHPHRAPALANIRSAESTADMRPLFAQTRLVLMPSVWEEAWGRIVSEAQLSGIPAIASDRGGLAETVGPGGAVLPIDAPIERWCEAVEAMFTDDAHYAALSRAARAHALRPEMAPDYAVARFLDFIAA